MAVEQRTISIPGERKPKRSEGSGMLIDDPLWWGEQMLAQPAGDLSQSSGERRTNPSEGEELRRSAGSGMLIDDPL